MKRTPGEAGRCFVARDVALSSLEVVDLWRGERGPGTGSLHLVDVDDGVGFGENERPVMKEQMRRTIRERQRITRETRAGRLCHVRAMVPKVRITRREVRR